MLSDFASHHPRLHTQLATTRCPSLQLMSAAAIIRSSPNTVLLLWPTFDFCHTSSCFEPHPVMTTSRGFASLSDLTMMQIFAQRLVRQCAMELLLQSGALLLSSHLSLDKRAQSKSPFAANAAFTSKVAWVFTRVSWRLFNSAADECI